MSSLFVIEHALSDLVEQRSEIEQEIAFTPEQIEQKQLSLNVVDQAIREYLTAEVRKVDNIARYLVELKVRQEAIKAEVERLEGIGAVLERQEKRLKEMVLAVMTEVDEKKLTGKIGTLRRVGNGGVQPVEVQTPDLLPSSLRRVAVSFPGDVWKNIKGYLRETVTDLRTTAAVEMADIKKKEEPDLTAIRQQLERGEGVPGARLLKRGEHCEYES